MVSRRNVVSEKLYRYFSELLSLWLQINLSKLKDEIMLKLEERFERQKQRIGEFESQTKCINKLEGKFALQKNLINQLEIKYDDNELHSRHTSPQIHRTKEQVTTTENFHVYLQAINKLHQHFFSQDIAKILPTSYFGYFRHVPLISETIMPTRRNF